MDQAIQQPTTGKSTGKKIILISFGVLAVGAASYFGYEHWKKKKEQQASADDGSSDNTSDLNLTPPTKSAFNLPPATAVRNDDFPLKKGSKGAKVKQMQQVLIAKLGTGSLGKAGADGDFGSKTEAALTKAGFPTSIDESTFNVMVQNDDAAASNTFDADAIATALYIAASKKDFPNTIKSLQKLNSKEDYTSVSESFKNNYRINGVRQTLVNGILGSFSDTKQKQAIRLQFTRIGLNYDGKKWSLSGLDTASVITTQATIVWEHPKKGIKVPANMVLGKEVAQRGEHTLFENNGQYFLVETKTINYL
jgi:peptidoglycan hydrolase-like protein with peptidoglycan-binding domain